MAKSSRSGAGDDHSSHDDTNTIVVNREMSSMVRLPLDVLQLCLSFLPAAFTLLTLTSVSSRFAAVVRSEEYWCNLWADYTAACFGRYVQSASLSTEGSPPTISRIDAGGTAGVPVASCRQYILFLASISKAPQLWLGCFETNGKMRFTEIDDVIKIGLPVKPLLLLSAHIDVAAVARHCARSAAEDKETESAGRGERKPGVRCCNDPLRQCKALCFLEHGAEDSAGVACRPMIDGIHAIRLLVFSHTLPPPGRRDGTALEREGALVEFVDSIEYAWDCCHPARQLTSAPTRAGTGWQLTMQMEEVATSIFFDSDAVAVRAEGRDYRKDIFFYVVDSSPSSSSSVPIAVRGEEAALSLRYPLEDTLVYLFLLHHVTFSDIHQHAWDHERKCAICSRLVSPTGHAVEFRFFLSWLIGSYPRFFVNAVFAAGHLPRTCIQETFDQENHPIGTTTAAAAEEEEEEDSPLPPPKLATLFLGGYGRVEVDIAPTVSREDFVRLRDTLGLSTTFPMPLLWNVVMFATGVGGAVLREHQPSFSTYYQSSFTAAFEKVFPSHGTNI
ncbi:hypothetical protein DQ04_02441030 [Trypanosoma grayi]|uniref:hypothetical protein n=1 Tax=Trypanosoma grayi TaxID=71804 RepID=UPI0004F43990|nr:hypothetical protein DQ04_02441030 [Trypanosoma grayi]KEG11614.1 hypothetical protein DQ04_02441030 [Trypanosoma grayi]